MLAALDIETKPKAGCEEIEEAGLVPHLSEITVMAVVASNGDRKIFRVLEDLWQYLSAFGAELELTFHNGKFDLKHLIYHDPRFACFTGDDWAHDSILMAHIHVQKVPEAFLNNYEIERMEANKRLKRGFSHRKAGALSLKTLAPYFLGATPFWETPENHDNDEYVLLDCEYTLKLTQYFLKHMTPQELTFYKEFQLPWTKMLLHIECQGITLDTDALSQVKTECLTDKARIESALQAEWLPAYSAFHETQRAKVKAKYDAMAQVQIDKKLAVNPLYDTTALKERYEKMFEAALEQVEPLNLNSPTQLTWLLRDHLGYDIHGYDGSESTDKEVLQKLAKEGKKDVAHYLEYRENEKILSAFIPTYERLLRPSKTIHPSFNPTGARTGRTSSSLPNAQQIPGWLHKLFTASKPGNLLITRDFSALEPVLIAYFTQDPLLKQIVKSGQSFHSVNAMVMFNLSCSEKDVKTLYANERDAAKEAGLSILYGAGANRLMISLQKRGIGFSLDQCKRMVYALRDQFKAVWKFKQELDAMLEGGELIYNFMGRPILFTNPEDVYLKGFNKLIQGSGSDILLESARQITQIPGLTPKLLVHDEAVIEADLSRISLDTARQRIDSIMTHWDLGDLKLSVEGNDAYVWKK